MVLPGFDYEHIPRRSGLTDAVDFDPALPLKKAEDLLIGFYVWTMIIVRHRAGSVKRKSTVVEARPFDDLVKKM